jgi:hypothetical protein
VCHNLSLPINSGQVEPSCLPMITSGTPAIPSTGYQAHCIGLAAAERGEDLVYTVHAALQTWRLDPGLWELAELITCMTLGYWTGTSPDPEGRAGE